MVFNPVMGLHTQHSVYSLFIFKSYSYWVHSHLQGFSRAVLDLFGMRLLRDEVSNILLLTHLRGGGKSGQGLRNEELGISLQAGESTDIRQRLVLFIIHYSLFIIIYHGKIQTNNGISRQIELGSHTSSVLRQLLLCQILALQCHSNVIPMSFFFPTFHKRPPL